MADGFIEVRRSRSGKMVRLHAEYVGMINETHDGCMLNLMDRTSQVHTNTAYAVVVEQHAAAMQKLYKSKPARHVEADAASAQGEPDDGCPF